MIVTVDGPAGAGKSTAARALARRLGFRLLNTGAMYRAVALAAVRAGIDLADAEGLAALAREISIELRGGQVLLNGEDVTTDGSPNQHYRSDALRRQQSGRAQAFGEFATRDRGKR